MLSNLEEKLTIDTLQNVCLESLLYDNRSLLLLMHYEAYSFLWRVLEGAVHGHNNVGPAYITKIPLGTQPPGR